MGTDMKRIMVTGALGQIGSELTTALRERYGAENIIASDIRPKPDGVLDGGGPYEAVDVTDIDALTGAIKRHRIDSIFHMAAILSAKGEREWHECWRVNMRGDINVLEAGRQLGLTRLFVPSSIAVYGPDVARDNTPQRTSLIPQTMYGITKVTGELLGEYYTERFGVDVRGVRYPGIISSETPPGGGTTDYAVEIFYEAIRHKHYRCFVREDTTLPMMYMPDAIAGSLALMEADRSRLHYPASYNISAMSFSAGDLAAAITRHIPDFTCEFDPDPKRQAIADAWPRSIDDSLARREWDWSPSYDLDSMTKEMLERLSVRL